MGILESVIENFSIAFSNPINIVIFFAIVLACVGIMWFIKKTIDGNEGG